MTTPGIRIPKNIPVLNLLCPQMLSVLPKVTARIIDTTIPNMHMKLAMPLSVAPGLEYSPPPEDETGMPPFSKAAFLAC